jgi:hypothetical protein
MLSPCSVPPFIVLSFRMDNPMTAKTLVLGITKRLCSLYASTGRTIVSKGVVERIEYFWLVVHKTFESLTMAGIEPARI